MTKKKLKELTEVYKQAEQEVTELDDIYGIRIWDAPKANFYNKYNLLIHELLIESFDADGAELIEDYCLSITNVSFDDLCVFLKITD